jgi:peptide methionine sulfoxide reductase MsrA
MKDLIRKVLKEEISLESGVSYFDNEVYQLLLNNVKVSENSLGKFFDNQTYKSIEIKFPDGYVENVNVTFRNKRYVLNNLMDLVYDVFPDIDQRTAVKTIRVFMNDIIYI